MSPTSDDRGSGGSTAWSEAAELRTIGFRLREIQRLLGTRVEQENRRLEAEGIEPVTQPRFSDEDPSTVDPARRS